MTEFPDIAEKTVDRVEYVDRYPDEARIYFTDGTYLYLDVTVEGCVAPGGCYCHKRLDPALLETPMDDLLSPRPEESS